LFKDRNNNYRPFVDVAGVPTRDASSLASDGKLQPLNDREGECLAANFYAIDTNSLIMPPSCYSSVVEEAWVLGKENHSLGQRASRAFLPGGGRSSDLLRHETLRTLIPSYHSLGLSYEPYVSADSALALGP